MTTSIILHHGGQILLPRGRYWIGDPKAAGVDAVAPASDLDGFYVRDGVVAGVFCRSMFDDAEYGIDDDFDEVGLAALGRARGIDGQPTLRASGSGVAIIALEGVPGVGEILPPSEIHGFVLDFPGEINVERCGSDLADIEISSTGSPVVRLCHYIRRDRPATPTTQQSVSIALSQIAKPGQQEGWALEQSLDRLLGRDMARRLRSQGDVAIPVAGAVAAGRLIAAADAVAAIHGRHAVLQAHLTNEV